MDNAVILLVAATVGFGMVRTWRRDKFASKLLALVWGTAFLVALIAPWRSLASYIGAAVALIAVSAEILLIKLR